MKKSTYEGLFRRKTCFSLMHSLATSNFKNLGNHVDLYKSQIGQELMVLSELNFKKNGGVVEFGATNGVALSNTFLPEKHFE